MSTYRRLDVSDVGDVTVVRFRDQKIIEDVNIQELGHELFRLVEVDERGKILLNFSNVDFTSSSMLGKLMTLDKKVKAHGGTLKLSNVCPKDRRAYAETKLDRLFEIHDDEIDALVAF